MTSRTPATTHSGLAVSTPSATGFPAPEKLISDDQLDELIDRLAAEFGFDPKDAVAWRHSKGRAPNADCETGTACDQHYHLCVREVDPVTGGVLSSSHDRARHCKVARAVEVAWGHAVLPTPHARSILATLEREGDAKTAAAIRELTPADHPAAFGEADHQRLKRAGFDLPRLRQMVAQALGESEARPSSTRNWRQLGFGSERETGRPSPSSRPPTAPYWGLWLD